MAADADTPLPLRGTRLLTLAVNVPGPVAAARLRQLGAAVVKVEPPAGDPLAIVSPGWYRELAEGQEVLRLDLKDPSGRARLHPLLAESDLLLTSTRPAALERLGLGWQPLHQHYPRLCQVAIVGHPAPHEQRAGHDLTYQAELGLISPPQMPRTLLADLAGAERVVSTALALLLARERGVTADYAQVSLVEAAAPFAEPLRHGLTAQGGALGGGLPRYRLYHTREGWIALAALEPHFWQRLTAALDLAEPEHEPLERVFLSRSAAEWEAWAAERDLPLVAVRGGSAVPAR
ncbi:MAG TPA: CoA transferase [Longimicrobiaceae bacterium]|nr:CoA transferase [Longimicrobiaceae bacterium]